MKSPPNTLRVLIISQWPKVKNAEYELIEKIRKTKLHIKVVDPLGFDVDSGVCLNTPNLHRKYDFAIALHYDTPKFLNIRTFLWIANPPEFMYLSSPLVYRNQLLPGLRSFDGYLFNGSLTIESQLRSLLTESEMNEKLNHYFYPSSSAKSVLPFNHKKTYSHRDKLFYCGINWERCRDNEGRESGLLRVLDDAKAADFYGPKFVDEQEAWAGFSSYKGTIPFDGVSLIRVMAQYKAVLALSSPVHLRSETSSSRVFEGFSAGVPVISDENPHVKKLFGDDVFYFSGTSEDEKCYAILELLSYIEDNPDVVLQKVQSAQAKITQFYCFEESLFGLKHKIDQPSNISLKHQNRPRVVDVFLFSHSPYSKGGLTYCLKAEASLLEAISVALTADENLSFKVWIVGKVFEPNVKLPDIENFSKRISFISFEAFLAEKEEDPLHQEFLSSMVRWDELKMARKIQIFSSVSQGDIAVFLRPGEQVCYDYFLKPLRWFSEDYESRQHRLYIAGFFINDLSEPASSSSLSTIIRQNTPTGLYIWNQNSLAQTELGQFFLTRSLMKKLNLADFSFLDISFPLALALMSQSLGVEIYRSPYFLMRFEKLNFHKYFEAYSAQNTFWGRSYNLLSCHTQELNALYDQLMHYESIVPLLDGVVGISPEISGSELELILRRVHRVLLILKRPYAAYKKTRRIFIRLFRPFLWVGNKLRAKIY